jgi:hypothetical protein
VLGPPSSDLGLDPSGTEFAPVPVVVVAAVGGDPLGPSAWPADLAAYRWDALNKRHELGDVGAVAAGDRPGERDPGRVDQEMVLGPFLALSTGLGPVSEPLS